MTTTSERTDTRAFLRRVTVATGGGMFIDGFVFASFAAALAGAGMSSAIGVSSVWASVISSSTLVGTFVGGLFLGYVTDKVGRRPMFTLDLSVFLACALLMFFVAAAWQVALLGLIMGVAIGADYSIGSPLLAEFTDDHRRGHYLGLLEILWNVGYVSAYLIGYVVNTQLPRRVEDHPCRVGRSGRHLPDRAARAAGVTALAAVQGPRATKRSRSSTRTSDASGAATSRAKRARRPPTGCCSTPTT